MRRKFHLQKSSPLRSLHTCPLLPPNPSSPLTPTHSTHLPSVLPHRRVQILGRCWVSTVSQLNKTIWKQSGPVNVPAQSDPSPFVAVEKNGLSESRGWGGGRVVDFNPQVTPISTHPDPLLLPPLLSSPPHTHPHFKCTLQRWTCYLKQSCLCCSTSKNKILPLFLSLISFSLKPLSFALFPLYILFNVIFLFLNAIGESSMK